MRKELRVVNHPMLCVRHCHAAALLSSTVSPGAESSATQCSAADARY